MSALLGYELLPFTVADITRDLHVAIISQLDEDYYLGVNFVRAFKAVFDPDTDRLYCKDAKAYFGLEVTSLDTKGMASAAIGIDNDSKGQRRELQEFIDRGLSFEKPGLGCLSGSSTPLT